MFKTCNIVFIYAYMHAVIILRFRDCLFLQIKIPIQMVDRLIEKKVVCHGCY